VVPDCLALVASSAISLPPEPAVVPVVPWSRPAEWGLTTGTVVAARRVALKNIDAFAAAISSPACVSAPSMKDNRIAR